MEAVRLYTEPKLRNPSLIAAWPGMGGVAIIAARYLVERLEAKEFGYVEPYEFFDPGVVSIRGNVVEEPAFPECKFHSWKKRGADSLVILTGDAQPSVNAYRLANQILDAAQKLVELRLDASTIAACLLHDVVDGESLGLEELRSDQRALWNAEERAAVEALEAAGVRFNEVDARAFRAPFEGFYDTFVAQYGEVFGRLLGRIREVGDER